MATDEVTVAIGNNPGSGTFSGTQTVEAVNGIASFSDLAIERAGIGYTLIATSVGLTSSTSASFDITAAQRVLSPDDLCSDYPASAIATFEDASLDSVVRARVRLSFGVDDLKCGLLSRFEMLDATASGIEGLVGIQNLAGLTYLSLNDNAIADISPLSGLTMLSELHLDHNANLTDIQPLLDNTGLGANDHVSLEDTNVSCSSVALLQAKGVTVQADCP
jgi:Leucine-rich repeat (LRR) protein